MGSMRLSALLTAAVLAAAAAWGQEDPAAEERALKKAAQAFEKKKPLSPEEAAELKKKRLLYCKKTGGCKPKELEKEKPPKPGAQGPLSDDVPAFDVPEYALEEDAAVAAPAGERAEALRQKAGERRERAVGSAWGAAESLRRSLLPAEAGAEEEGAGLQEVAAARGVSGGGESVRELALAEKTGFAAVFRSQGLKVGSGPQGEAVIKRLDGSPAGAAELGRLRAVLRSEPEALRRRPDFFSVITRAQFSELKRDYAARPELRGTAFKHMVLTEGGRDFRWSASCGPLTGDCNPVAEALAYRKGQDVSPEDLEEVWGALDEESEEDDEDWEEYTEEDRRLAAEEDRAAEKLAAGRGRLSALSALLSRLGGLAGWTGEDTASEGAGSGTGPVSASRQPASEEHEARSDGTGAAGSGPGGTFGPSSGPPPAPGARGTAAHRGWLYALFAAAAAGFIVLGLRKKA